MSRFIESPGRVVVFFATLALLFHVGCRLQPANQAAAAGLRVRAGPRGDASRLAVEGLLVMMNASGSRPLSGSSSSFAARESRSLAAEPRGLSPVELEGPHSEPLACGISNPMPGGVTAGYAADTGLDLAGSARDVFAIASGTLDYAEAGHTAWHGRHDSPFAARLALDVPIRIGDRAVTHVWYAHLSEVALEVREGSGEIVHVKAGARLGRSGSANGSPHLHLGMLLDGDVDQAWGTFLLEDQVREILCRWGKGKSLPEADGRSGARGTPVAARNGG